MQRCQFLATIPQTTTADTSRVEEIVEDRSVTDDGTHSITDCSSVLSGLNNIHVTADMNDDPLEAEGVREKNGLSGADIRWSSDPIEVDTYLDPENACLVVAANVAEREVR